MDKNDEMILVVERRLLDDLGSFQGLRLDVARHLDALLDPANQRFLRRGDVEDDPSLKQLIPYCIIHCGPRVLRYTRGQSGGEDRLHARLSIGIGGHINNKDAEGDGRRLEDGSTYRRAVHRELHEELHLPDPLEDEIVALLNDDSDPVGRVHLGVVHRIGIQDPDAVIPAEDGIATPEWIDAGRVLDEADRLESWSAHCAASLPRLLGLVPPGTPPRP